jgi:hypothetical protein
MKKANRTSVPIKLVLRRESLVVLGVTQLRAVAGASVLDHCTTHMPTFGDTGAG